jgi:dienelactone hydrolase
MDAYIQSAIAHWGPRFVSNGVALADFEEVTASMESWQDWCRAWSARGAIHEEMGREALARSRLVSAAEHLNRASVYYHFAKFLFVHDLAQMHSAHVRAVECRRLALPFLRPSGERVEMPYEGKWLAGILRRPAGTERPPVVVMVMGLDSAKEEMETNEQPFLDRGMATLSFDGPGQGEGEYDFAIRGDYEAVLAAVLDWLETRSDIDTSAIGLWGVSLGGYYAPRAAAFERRVRACIALSGPYNFGEVWDDLPDLTRQAFRVRSKCDTEEQARHHAATLSLAGLAERITCPICIVTGKRDRVIPWRQAERLAREVRGRVELMILEDANHVANNRIYCYRPQTADWMADQLGGRAAGRGANAETAHVPSR